MDKLKFELYLDESGDFIDDNADSKRRGETSLVGGLLIQRGKLTDRVLSKLLQEPVHCRDRYKKEYLEALEEIKELGGNFVIFENKERLKIINGDTTYLNIITEGLIKLFRDLSNDNSEGINIRVIIATRKAVDSKFGIIKAESYIQRLEEKIIMGLGRAQVNGCEYEISFQDARKYRRLDFADIICNTWFTRKRKSKFASDEQVKIEELYKGQMIYPVFEDAMTAYLKQLMLERHLGEAVYQLCTLKNLKGFTNIRNQLMDLFLNSDRYEKETWFAQISLLISQYNKLRMYEDGIRLAENYINYFLNDLEKMILNSAKFWHFDTDYFLLTMYDHIGNTVKCEEHLKACKNNISCVNRSWEHIDYYFGFCIRELNVLMGRYAFEEAIKRADGLIKIFTEAKELFSMIKTYDNTEQSIRSELLGKVYGVRLEAMINLLYVKADLKAEVEEVSKKALAEFSDDRDISRQWQWRCLLICELNKPDEAYEALMKAVNIEISGNEVQNFLDLVYEMKAGTYDFLLWHYTNVMLCMKKNSDSRAVIMADKLRNHPNFISDKENKDKKGHPWNLVLWNVGRYERALGKQPLYEKFYKKAVKITCENKSNVTMMAFALSMSADRLLWCIEHSSKEKQNA